MDKNAQNTIMDCLEEKKMTQTELAKRMGYDRRNLNQKLHRTKSMKADEFIDMLDKMGYDIEIRDKADK